MTDPLDAGLRARLERLARAVPVRPEVLRPVATVTPRYRGPSGFGVLAAAGLVLVLVLAAASMGGGTNPSATIGPSPSGSVASMTDGTFRLTIRAPRTNYGVDEPIEVEATLEYIGTDPSVVVYSAPGMPGFGVEQLDGDHRADPAYRLSCASRSLVRAQPVDYPFVKSGGYSPEMPDADFVSRYLNIVDGRADPVLRLPTGTWRIFAEAELAEGGCDGTAHKLDVGITIVVAGPLASPTPPAQDWGPLAVAPRQDGMNMARNEGSLRITDSCVYLEWAGELTLLVWHEGQPTWNEASRTITFENFDGIVVTMRDGDRIEVGGSGGGSGESGESGEEFVRRMEWLAPPDPSCSVDRWWGVGAVAQLAWGPLAVAREDAQNDLDAGTGPGRLVVGARCVTLLQDAGAELTLIWRSAQTGWDPDAREILFDDRNLGVIRLSDGERLSLGGAGLADPASPDQGAPQPEWMAPPDPSCPDARWVVHQVYRLDQ